MILCKKISTYRTTSLVSADVISFCKNQVTLPLVTKEGQRNKEIFAESNDSTFSKYFVPATPLAFKEEG